MKHRDRSLRLKHGRTKRKTISSWASLTLCLLRQSHEHNPSGWQRQEWKQGKGRLELLLGRLQWVTVRSSVSRWERDRGTEGQSCVTTRPLAGPHRLSHAPAPCLRQGSHRAWLWKALLGGSTAGPWHSWGAPAAWGNTSYSRKSTQPQGSMKMPLQVRMLHPGGMNTAKSQPGQMDLSGLQKMTVLMSASPEVVVRKLKVGSHTVWGANQDQRAIRKQNSCPWFFISHIYREHGYIDTHPHTYRVPRA